MKTAHFVFVLLGLAALTLGPGLAGETSDQARQPALSEHRTKASDDRPSDRGQEVQPRAGSARADGKPSDKQQEISQAAEKSSPSGRTKPRAKPQSGPRLLQPFQANAEHSGEKRNHEAQAKTTLGNAADFRQPGLNKSAGSAKAGPTINPMENHRGLPVAGLSTPTPPSHVVPRRGPAPAIIGGLANSSASNAAVINGTEIKHRP